MGIDASANPAEFIRELNAEIGLPANLGEMGVKKNAIADLSIHAAKDVCTFTNPRSCSAEEYEGLYEIAIG